MTRHVPLWTQDGDYAASIDRRLMGALWPEAVGRCDGCAVGIAGTGDMNVAVQPGMVAVPTPNATGTTLCYSDGVELVTLDAAPAAGQDRNDIIVCRVSGPDIDAGVGGFVFEKVSGTPAPPPNTTWPAVPPGCVHLASVSVLGGSVTVDPALIYDARPGTLAVPAATPPYVPPYPIKPAVHFGHQNHYQGSKNAGTYTSAELAIGFTPTVASKCRVTTMGKHGYGGGATTVNFTLRRKVNGVVADCIGSGALQAPAANTVALYTASAIFDLPANAACSFFYYYTVTGSNNYFGPWVTFEVWPV